MSDLERLTSPPSFKPIHKAVMFGRIIVRASFTDVAKGPTPGRPEFHREAEYGLEDRTGHTYDKETITSLPAARYDADIEAWRVRRPEGRFGTYSITNNSRERVATATIKVPSLLGDEHFGVIQKFAYRQNGQYTESGESLGETVLHIADETDTMRTLNLRWNYPATTLLDPHLHAERAAKEIMAGAVGLLMIDEDSPLR